MYVPTWVHISVWFWYGFGSGLYYTKTIPKPYQNQTTKSYILGWFDFGLVLVCFLKPNQHQKWTKNKPKTKPKYTNPHLRTVCGWLYGTVEAIFINFWYGFGFVLGLFLMLVRLQKPYQNRRVGIGTWMRTISINGVPPFLSIACNLLLSEALFQLLRAIIGGRKMILRKLLTLSPGGEGKIRKFP